METNTNHTMTKYDKKMQARREAEAKEKKKQTLVKAVVAAVLVCVLAVIIATPIMKKKEAKETFLVVGTHEVSLIEYNYYYASTVNQFLTMYSSLLPYLGLDTSKSFAAQQYSEDMTWQDFFDRMTMGFLAETKTLVDDAANNNFTYDVAKDYTDYLANIAEAAKNANMSEKKYFKSVYGEYATKESLKEIMEEYLLSQAYYEHVLEQNAPTEEEITAYYEDHKINYDTVNYRIFAIAADVEKDADEDTVAAAMKKAKSNADKMAKRAEAGEDFAELCREFATEEEKELYEKDEASLKKSISYNSATSTFRDWLFDETRKENDVTVVENATSDGYYVVNFLERSFDEDTRETIADTIASETSADYLAELAKAYVVTDTEGNVVYTPGETDDAE